ncbi:ArpU family phage packaging/lysis transcriptional regulator [Brevibacillus centrosporus]|uniref:ArpU family phage packaging/lysis transcriptional regulator n=1 Tax=Brevibacillus centrosporus TaxID=54910 RepID=UPI002E1EB4F7|nr:ArpU family phage packaging/lysis transcriptional regulator [Brevibacillus centrosporus]MED1954860.1 ArpU family phage packaging/lysis transcriptional regulator [Brevibacillus centrosporus]
MEHQQLTLPGLPEIDEEATAERVKEYLDRARDFIRMGFHPGIVAATTYGYSDVPPTQTNAFHSSTENTAVKNVDIEAQRKNHVQRVLNAIKHLSKRERKIITTRWFGDDDLTDLDAYTELEMSHGTYYKYRAKAYYRLAFALKIEVYKNVETN